MQHWLLDDRFICIALSMAVCALVMCCKKCIGIKICGIFVACSNLFAFMLENYTCACVHACVALMSWILHCMRDKSSLLLLTSFHEID